MFHKILNVKLSISVVALIVMLTSAYGELRKQKAEVALANQNAAAYKALAEKFVGTRVDTLRSIKVTVTSYNPTKSQCGNNKAIGSSGELVTPGVVAVSHDLRKKYGIKDGDVIILEELGKFTVKDTMDKRFKKRVDILSLIPSYSSKFGAKKNVTLYYNKER